MSATLVRPARREDAPAILRTRVLSWQAAYRGMVPGPVLDGMRVDDAHALARTRSRLEPAGVRAFVVVATCAGEGGGVVGFVSSGPQREAPAEVPAAGAATAEVYALYVLPAAWGTGTGTRLLRAAVDALALDGHDAVSLWVLEANARARRFYERAGFRPTGERQEVDLGAPLPELRYARPLERRRSRG